MTPIKSTSAIPLLFLKFQDFRLRTMIILHALCCLVFLISSLISQNPFTYPTKYLLYQGSPIRWLNSLVVAGIFVETIMGAEAGYIIISVGCLGVMIGSLIYGRVFKKSHNQTLSNQKSVG